jgi:thiol-disulfide isomerase/thioredoxin
MRISLAILILLSAFAAHAQNDSLDAPYKRFPTIPPFDLLQTDSSTHLTKDKIDQKRNTIIMYFSPDCSHCQHQTEEMIKGMDSLKEVQIVMATYLPFEEMVDFYKKYQLAKYPNIKLGRDVKFFLPPYYRMKSLPYLALYKKGSLVTTYEGNQTVTTLVEAFDHKTIN